MSLMGGQSFRLVWNMSLWKTISHWTRLSGEKKDVAWRGSCRRRLGLAGRPDAERQMDGVSREKRRRQSDCWDSFQL